MSSPQTGPESTQRPGTTEPTTPEQQKQWATTMAPTQATTESGWLAFAGTMLLLIGIFNVIGGLAAIFQPTYYVVSDNGLMVFNFAIWGWIMLVLGAVQIASGIGCMYGQEWARITGIVLAGLCAIAHLAFLASYPVWSVLVIALSVVVIYGLMVPSRNAVA